MLKKILFAASLAALPLCLSAAPSSADVAPPAYAGDVEASGATVPPPARRLEPKAPAEGMSLAPSEEDMARARAERESGHIPPKRSSRTKIEAVRDQDNRVTEYIVTPGSTQIPYTIENRAERPIDSTPGGNSKSTLGTPKFIEFGW